MKITSTIPAPSFDFGNAFTQTNELIKDRFNDLLTKNVPLFKVDISGKDVWKLYLETIEEIGGTDARRHFNCSACRTTVERFGNVVIIDADIGSIIPVMWIPYMHENPLLTVHNKINQVVSGKKIVSAWYSKDRGIGYESTYDSVDNFWTHMSVCIPDNMVKNEDAHAMMMKSIERFSTLMNQDTGIHGISIGTFETAVQMLTNSELDRSEIFLAVARFHRDIKLSLSVKEKNSRVSNLIWLALMIQPKGWENVNSTAIGELYKWVGRNDSLDEIKGRWNAMVSGTSYQRPQAAPNAETIKQAEELVAKLGIEKSLHRRFARLDEIRCFWKPEKDNTNEAPASGGVFSSVKPKNNSTIVENFVYEASRKPVTWEKFIEKILPEADFIEMVVPLHGAFSACVTATHEDAPPILSYDREDDRYPVSSYVYHNGSNCNQWTLSSNESVKVNGISKIPGHDEAYILILEGCKDIRTDQGIGLFPELLRSELHGIRSVIESFSNTSELTGADEASACGYLVGGNNFNIVLTVTSGKIKQSYLIDRKD